LAESAAALSSQHHHHNNTNQSDATSFGDGTIERRSSSQTENPTLEQLLRETSLYTADSSPKNQQRPLDTTTMSATTTNTAAAEVLGYRSNPQLLQQNRMRNEVKQTIKELGGAFKGMAKEVALAGKKTLSSTTMAVGNNTPYTTSGGGVGGTGTSSLHHGGSAMTHHTGAGGLHGSTMTDDGFIAGGGSVSMWDAPNPPLQVSLCKLLQKDSVVGVLQACSKLRGHGKILSPEELEYYSHPDHQGISYRMALGAELAGRNEEAHFWRLLPATLRQLQGSDDITAGQLAAAVLWSAESIISESKERSRWHDSINRI
jgi:hypothetical protein